MFIESAWDSLLYTGGFTLDVKTGELVTCGFAVSTDPDLTYVVHESEAFREDLFDYVRQNASVLLDEPDKFFGGWFDTTTGLLHLDVITVVSTGWEAELLACAHSEIAYYDLSTGTEHRI